MLVRAVQPLGARVYYVGGLMFAVVGPVESEQRVDLSVARQAMAGAAEELGASAVHGEAHMPQDGPGPALLAVALRRMQARTRRQGSSVERQIRDVLLALLAERRAGGTPISLPKVGSHVVVVGRALGLSVEQLDETVRAAELQDVGKLVIPEAILTKRGALTDEEWRVIRTHPVIAARIIAAAPALSPVAKLVRASAERWDGSGYPDGLQRRGDPARLAHHRGLRRVRRDDRDAPLSRGADPRRGDRRAPRNGRSPVRSGGRGGLLRRDARAAARRCARAAASRGDARTSSRLAGR